MRFGIKPQVLTVLTTDQCTAACDHCCMNSSPDRKDRLSLDHLKRGIDQLEALGELGVVVFAGGEPLLTKNTLLEAIKYCFDRGVATRLVTSCSWGVTSSKAETIVRQLRDAGLREINLSVDDYHLPFIPFEHVKNVWDASHGVGFSSVVIACNSHCESTITPEWVEDKLNRKLPRSYDDLGIRLPDLPAPEEDGTRYLISNSKIQILGRGKEALDSSVVRLPESQDALDTPCQWAVRSPAISPRGDLLACCGHEVGSNSFLNFGSLEEADATQLLSDACDDVLVVGVSTIGPYALLKFAQSYEPDLHAGREFRSVCEVCSVVTDDEKVVKVLRDHQLDLASQIMRTAIPKRKAVLESDLSS